MSVGGCKDYTDLGGPEVGTTDYWAATSSIRIGMSV
jgi:hypothetical protein